MADLEEKTEDELYVKLKWLMFARVVFTSLLLGSTIILQLSENVSPTEWSLLILYGLIILIFILSFIYSILLNYIRKLLTFSYIQISIDTFVVTLIIFVTGSYSSIFSFLYLLVIIYSSLLLYMRGSMIMAAFSSIQYGILIDIEYYGFLNPILQEGHIIAADYAWSQVIYKVLITMMGCFAVAFLSGLLAEQARKTKKELQTMEYHVKRVEKMAAIGEMGAGLAHEIKNPLASLAGSIQLLNNSLRLDPDHHKLMQIVLREADRLSSLVNNFLLFAKPPAGISEPVDLEKAILGTVDLFKNDAGSIKDIQISVDIVPGLWVKIDPAHFQQVLWNLLLNSAEAIENQGTIDIKAYSADAKDKNNVFIEIKDNGCGMPREILQSIFDPFFTTKQNGTGLGLSIVHSILDNYESRIDVQSMVDEGTIFTLRLKNLEQPT